MAISKPDQRSKKIFRTSLTLVAIVSLAIGGVVLVRAFFLMNPPEISSGTDPGQLPQNLPTTILGVDTDISGSPEGLWGEEIDSNLIPELSRDLILVSQPGITQLVELEEGELSVLANLPAGLEQFRMYTGENYTYIVSGTNVSSARLVGVNDSDPIDLIQLESGWQFGSVLFDPAQKVFYYSQYSVDGEINIQKSSGFGGAIDIYTVIGSSVPRIIQVDSSKGVMYLQYGTSNADCSILHMDQKTTEPIDCDLIATTESGQRVSATQFVPAEYEEDDSGSITLIDTNTGNKKAIFTAELGIYPLFPVHRDGILAYLEYQLVENDFGVLELQLSAVVVRDTKEDKEVARYSDLPDQHNIQALDLDQDFQPVVINSVLNRHQLLVPNQDYDPEADPELDPDATLPWIEVILEGCELGCKFEFI